MAQEGAIVRNKATGAMGRIVNGQVVPMQPQTPAAPAGDPIIAPADPYKQAAEVRAQAGEVRADRDQSLQENSAALNNQLAQITIAEKSAKLAKEQEDAARLAEAQRSGERDAAYQLRNVIDAAKQAKEGANTLFGTGFGSETMSGFGGTNARNVQALLNTIGSNTAFDRLQKMRDQSPTGGALGAVSEIELRLLRDSIASLDQSQSDEQFKANMDKVIESYSRVLEKLEGGDPNLTADAEAQGGARDDGEAGLNVIVSDETRSPYDPGGGLNMGDITRPPEGRGGLMDLAKQGVTLGLADEAAGIGGYLSGFLTGEDPQSAYIRERDRARTRVEQAREDSPVLGTALEFLSGGGALRVAGAGANALRNVVQQGAGIGALGGFGYGEGAQGSVGNALLGAGAGGALGGAIYGAGRGIAAIANSRQGPGPTAEQLALVQAGQRQNVPLRQPDVRPELRNQMANAETGVTSGPAIRAARTQDAERIEQRIAEVGGGGAVSDPYALGTQVQGAGQRYIARTRQQATRLYDRARQEAAGATVQPDEAVAAIDNNIAELRAAGENSNAGQIAYLEGLRQDMSRPLTVEAVQNLRTNMRGQLSERGLTGTDAERRVAQVIDAANADLVRELPQNASQALRAADSFYRERQGFISNTLKQLMGDRGNPLPAETAASRLMSMTKGGGNYDRFSSMWRQLEPSEQADISATVAESLGRKANGEFSVATLIRSLDPAKGINPRTARLIFGDDGAQALADLRMIARAKTETQAGLNNSRTGVAVNAASGGLKNLMLGAFGFSTGGPVGAVAAPMAGNVIRVMGERRAARMLLNPDFTRWLRNAPNSNNPRVIDRYFSRLAGISSIPANDNQAFTAALREAFARSPSRAAASEQEQN